jgi:hypothetical protein
MHSVTIHLQPGNKFVIDCWADGSVDVRGWRSAELVPLPRLDKLEGKSHWPEFVQHFEQQPPMYHPFTGNEIAVTDFADLGQVVCA